MLLPAARLGTATAAPRIAQPLVKELLFRRGEMIFKELRDSELRLVELQVTEIIPTTRPVRELSAAVHQASELPNATHQAIQIQLLTRRATDYRAAMLPFSLLHSELQLHRLQPTTVLPLHWLAIQFRKLIICSS